MEQLPIIDQDDADVLNIIFCYTSLHNKEIERILNISKYQIEYTFKRLKDKNLIFEHAKDKTIEINDVGRNLINTLVIQNIYNCNKTVFLNSTINSLQINSKRLLTNIYANKISTLKSLTKIIEHNRTNAKINKKHYAYILIEQLVSKQLIGEYIRSRNAWSRTLSLEECKSYFILPLGKMVLDEIAKREKKSINAVS